MSNLDPGGLESSSDLPLLSNTTEIRIWHYLIDLKVNFEDRIFDGSVLIFLERPSENEKRVGASHCEAGGIQGEKITQGLSCSDTGRSQLNHSQSQENTDEHLADQCLTNRVQSSCGQSQDGTEIHSANQCLIERVQLSCGQSQERVELHSTNQCCVGTGDNLVSNRQSRNDTEMNLANQCFTEKGLLSCDQSQKGIEIGSANHSDNLSEAYQTEKHVEQSKQATMLNSKLMGKLECDGIGDNDETSHENIACGKASIILSGEKESAPSDEAGRILPHKERVVVGQRHIAPVLPVQEGKKVYPCGDDLRGANSVVSEQSMPEKTNVIQKRKSRIQEITSDPVWFTCILDCRDIDVEKVEEVIFDRDTMAESGQQTDNTPAASDSKPSEKEEHLNQGNLDNLMGKKKKQSFSDSEVILSKKLGYDRCNFDERNNVFLSYRHLPGRPLLFGVDDWSLSIWQEGVVSVDDFPAVVRIVYRTRPAGQSFTWAFDQAGRECVFTQGAWINNRSLFPCQEPPGAMATWQAFIQSPAEYEVLMSGDSEADKIADSNGLVTSYYYVNMVMPPSVLALAIGQWQGVGLSADLTLDEQNKGFIDLQEQSTIRVACHHEPWPCRIKDQSQQAIPSRIFAPKSILEAAREEFGVSIPLLLEASSKILGPHPFSRLDFVIMPYCFASMGLASPSIVFISSTLVAGDGSLVPRLAHEISHSWFGLLIGAMDWTEEWLSEGFATFLEDPIQALAEKWSRSRFHEMSDLRALLRYRTLKNEMKNTASELQIMRPMGDQSHMSGAVHLGFVKNGQHPDKWFLQVHYLKGYFLLHYLAKLVGLESLLRVMAAFVATYHGQLVLSEDFFKLLFKMCPTLEEHQVTPSSISRDWLDSPGMPRSLDSEVFIRGNRLIKHVVAESKTWQGINTYHRRRDKAKVKKRLKTVCPVPDLRLIPEQLCLLLENLIGLEISLHDRTLARLRGDFKLHLRNAEIRHRWCELVIKHRYQDGYGDIRMFLLKDQSMGVYLYGELLASGDPIQRLLAETCFEAVAVSMDRGCRRTVQEMLGLE